MTLADAIRIAGFLLVGLAFHAAGASFGDSALGILGLSMVVAASR